MLASCASIGILSSGTDVVTLVAELTWDIAISRCQDYFSLQAQDVNSVPTYAATGIAASNASSRISYFFDWHGVSRDC